MRRRPSGRLHDTTAGSAAARAEPDASATGTEDDDDGDKHPGDMDAWAEARVGLAARAEGGPTQSWPDTNPAQTPPLMRSPTMTRLR